MPKVLQQLQKGYSLAELFCLPFFSLCMLGHAVILAGPLLLSGSTAQAPHNLLLTRL